MSSLLFPKIIENWIDGKETPAFHRLNFPKLSPTDGKELCLVARSGTEDVSSAVNAAKKARPLWASLTPVKRGDYLHTIVLKMQKHQDELAKIVSQETGKSPKDALSEVQGAIAQGLFMVGEGMRLYGRTTTSSVPHKLNLTIRQPVGLTALIIAANTPIANVAWKVFPALICGNTAVLKAAEDTPITAWFFSKLAHEAGLPEGVLNVIQGLGSEAGQALVDNPDINLISFTGSTQVGRHIAKSVADRLVRISLELGGKNALIVCDDADLENASKWVVLSAFSNAGQRCAAASRILIFDLVYEKFKTLLIQKTQKLKIGPTDNDDFGPVINLKQLTNMLQAIEAAKKEGAKILLGGERLLTTDHKDGFYMAPTLIENVSSDAKISRLELFGPITILYRVKNFKEALELANNSPYGLTASIHTKSIDRAMEFAEKIEAGVAMVNAGTYGSEPHMPFGGVKNSGNGTREPGPEALNVYSELKNICIVTTPEVS